LVYFSDLVYYCALAIREEVTWQLLGRKCMPLGFMPDGRAVKSESCWIFSPGLHPLKAVF